MATLLPSPHSEQAAGDEVEGSSIAESLASQEGDVQGFHESLHHGAAAVAAGVTVDGLEARPTGADDVVLERAWQHHQHKLEVGQLALESL